MDGAWVNLRLVDENDNAPTYISRHARLTLPEDTPIGTHLTTFTARDLDGVSLRKGKMYCVILFCSIYTVFALCHVSCQGGQAIRYQVAPASDPGRLFNVDSSGAVRLVGGLDREVANTHSVLVWAVDQGAPPRTATATLSVSTTHLTCIIVLRCF